MIDPSAIDRTARCPHCQLPAELPEICTPALGAIIDASIARDWELFNAGFTLGLEMGREHPGAVGRPEPRR